MDLAAAVIIGACVFASGRRGIAHFAASALGKIISLFLSITLYGPTSGFLRKTPVFELLKGKIAAIVNVETLLSSAGVSTQIMANDNSEIYKLFRVETFEDYVTSYLANSALNILSILFVYMCVSIAISFFFRTSGVVSGLPLVKGLNGAAGVVIGLIEGTLLIWLLIIALVFFNLQGKLLNAYDMLLASNFAVYFLKYNLFLDVIFKITP